jgi:UDP-N-acetylglucosamine acyltransferase
VIDGRATVHPSARVAQDASIGPYSVIGADVEIGAGTWIGPHVVVQGPTRIGPNNRIFQFASVGDIPQDKKYNGERTLLEIGARNVIREYCTINRGTVQGGGITRIGDDNWIMAYVHIAHDCQVGSHTVFANGASLAGHVQVADHAVLGGFTLVFQFCRLGAHCFCAMASAIDKDVPPFVTVAGHMARPRGINTEGLRRRGFSSEVIGTLRRAYKVVYRSSLTASQAIHRLRQLAAECSEVGLMASFLEQSSRGIVR